MAPMPHALPYLGASVTVPPAGQIPDHPLVDASIRELRGSRILVLDQSGVLWLLYSECSSASAAHVSGAVRVEVVEALIVIHAPSR